jgi:hypothetical protein
VDLVAPEVDLVVPEAVRDNIGLLSAMSFGFYIHDMMLGQHAVDGVSVAPETDLLAISAASPDLLASPPVLSQIPILLLD